MRRGVVICWLVVSATAALALPSGAGAAPITASCTNSALLGLGQTVSCSTPTVTCPASATSLVICWFSTTATASATVSTSLKATAVDVVNGTKTVNPPPTITKSDSASCTSAALLNASCTAQTNNQPGAGELYWWAGYNRNSGESFTAQGAGTCTATEPLAVVVTINCTESVDYNPY